MEKKKENCKRGEGEGKLQIKEENHESKLRNFYFCLLLCYQTTEISSTKMEICSETDEKR